MNAPPVIPETVTTRELEPLRRYLEDADFREPALCRRLEIPDIYEFTPVSLGRPAGGEPVDVLDLLIRLFLDAEPVEAALLDRWMPGEVREILVRCGILRIPEDGPAWSEVLLYPTEGLHIASDPPHSPSTGGSTHTLRPDAVYPAVTRAAAHFVSSIPRSPCRHFLELCSGSGIGALVGARTAEHAWAVDITARSTRFARFNAALNGLENVTALQGDVWGPVGDRTFDRIVAHPPYMPSDEVVDIYRDAGADGESVVRGILAGLPAHLAPGGRFYATCTLTERRGVELEDRIRGMMGPEGAPMGVVLLTMGTTDPERSVANELLRGRVDAEQARRRVKHFGELEVESLTYLTFVVEKPPLERTGTGRPPVTLRRPRGPATGGAEIDWLMEVLEALGRAEGTDALAEARPRVSPGVHRVADSALEDGGWVPEETSLQTRHPFPTTVRCAPWLPDFVAGCDGTRTVRELLAGLREDGVVHDGVSEGDFLDLIRSFLVAGILHLPELPPPPAPDGGAEGGG